MKNVRVLYKKTDTMKFVSHLDMTRVMTRLLRKSGMDFWYTEGFNKHLYITFALPLSLGFESEYEILDFRLLNDDADLSKIPEKLNALSPKGIEFYDCFEPQDRLGDVAFAKYEIFFDDNCSLFNDLSEFLSKNEIICQKKTKKGDIKTFNFKEKIQSLQIADTVFGTKILLTLPAGSVDNVNPELLLNTYFETAKEYYPYSIIRLTVLNKEKKPFR